MGRYLFRIAYLGTNFTGVQLHSKPGTLLRTDKSVPAELLRCLRDPYLSLDKESFRVHSTSRTDQGVHALDNMMNIDIEPQSGRRMMHVDFLRKKINIQLKKRRHKLRVLDIQKVSDNMNLMRCTKYRRYIYRLAVVRSPDVTTELVHEMNLSKIVWTPFDMDKFLETAAVFSGSHDFSAFTTKCYFQRPENANKTRIRTIEIGVKRGSMIFEDLHNPDKYEMLEVHIKSRGFMYKQIRRMVNAMIEVARGKFTVEEIQKFLHEPITYTDNSEARILHSLGPDGLFLVEVGYESDEIQYNEESNEEDNEDSHVEITDNSSNKHTGRTTGVPDENESGSSQNILTKLHNFKNLFIKSFRPVKGL